MRRVTVVVILAVTGVCACTSTMQETRYDPSTRTAQVTTYAPYFETRTMLVVDKVGLNLVVDLEKKRIPGLYQVQQALGALGPGDLDATGLFTAYIHNLSGDPLQLEIAALDHRHQPVPGVPLTVELKPDSYSKVVLGRVGIMTYAKELPVTIRYSLGPESASKELVLRRLTPSQIEASVAQWKGKSKNVVAFFPD